MISPYHGSNVLIRNRESYEMGWSTTVSVSVLGKSQISSANTSDFFDLEFYNSKSKSCRITIHLEYFPPSNFFVKIYIIGLQLEITVVLRNSM